MELGGIFKQNLGSCEVKRKFFQDWDILHKNFQFLEKPFSKEETGSGEELEVDLVG